MKLTNSQHHYGWVSIVLHWSMAIALIGMHFLGDYMVGLDYYDRWYHSAPTFHKALGTILGLTLIFRLLWNFLQTKPAPFETKALMKRIATLGHLALYLLVLVMVVSGYFISTAKGQGVDVFGLFELPAFLPASVPRGKWAAWVHEISNTAFMVMVIGHVIAASAHHFILKDRTLTRMLWVKKTD